MREISHEEWYADASPGELAELISEWGSEAVNEMGLAPILVERQKDKKKAAF